MACAHLQLQFPSGVSRTIPTTSKPFSSSSSSSSSALHRGSPKGRLSANALSIGSIRPELDENPEAIISGEWPENISLLSFDDLRVFLEAQSIDNKPQATSLLGEVMSTPILTAAADQTLEEIDHHFEYVSGLPVVDDDLRCIGVISKRDRARASLGLKSKVSEIMSFPPITLPPSKTVKDAAALMLKMKIHRIPIVDEGKQVIGIITRCDVFKALEAQ